MEIDKGVTFQVEALPCHCESLPTYSPSPRRVWMQLSLPTAHMTCAGLLADFIITEYGVSTLHQTVSISLPHATLLNYYATVQSTHFGLTEHERALRAFTNPGNNRARSNPRR